VYVARMRQMMKAWKIFAGKPEGKRLLGDNMRMNIREIGWKFVDWMHLAQDRDPWRAPLNTVMDLRVP